MCHSGTLHAQREIEREKERESEIERKREREREKWGYSTRSHGTMQYGVEEQVRW